MGKMLSLMIGTAVAIFGLILFFAWMYEFLFVLRGIIPVILIVGGVIAILAGVSELKDTLKIKKEGKK